MTKRFKIYLSIKAATPRVILLVLVYFHLKRGHFNMAVYGDVRPQVATVGTAVLARVGMCQAPTSETSFSLVSVVKKKKILFIIFTTLFPERCHPRAALQFLDRINAEELVINMYFF